MGMGIGKGGVGILDESKLLCSSSRTKILRLNLFYDFHH